jgi:hypothetical protein
MDSLIFYWVLTLVVLLVLTMLTNIGTASIITAFIMIIKFMVQIYDNKNISEGTHQTDNILLKTEQKIQKPLQPVDNAPHKKLPTLKPDVILENIEMIDDILYPKLYSADDRIYDASVISGHKEKKAKEIRSHWNNNNVRKYYDYELGIHANREWWGDDDFELSKRHVAI